MLIIKCLSLRTKTGKMTKYEADNTFLILLLMLVAIVVRASVFAMTIVQVLARLGLDHFGKEVRSNIIENVSELKWSNTTYKISEEANGGATFAGRPQFR